MRIINIKKHLQMKIITFIIKTEQTERLYEE